MERSWVGKGMRTFYRNIRRFDEVGQAKGKDHYGERGTQGSYTNVPGGC